MIRFLVFLIGLLGTQHRILAQSRAQDSLVLVDLYNATGGANWTNPWYLNQSMDNWRGVTLSVEGRVQKLVLPERQLAGSLPSSIIQLSKLEVLQLHMNALTGSIPTNLDRLTNLTELYLHNNLFTGSIPPNLGNLVNLKYLVLSANRLTGSMPTSLGNLRRLRHLLLYGNQLTGSIPTSLGNLDSLTQLSLYSNQLTGSIPTSLGNLRQLDLLYLYSNQLSGSIPTELGNLNVLTQFYLYGNQLTGTIPTELGNLTNLQYLSLNSNQLTGSIPTSLGNLRRLRELLLAGNRLSGAIPTSLGNLDSLEILSAFQNELTGSIPTNFTSLRRLKRLYLYLNQLSGTIPTNLGNLDSLNEFYVYKNQLTGAIPISFQNATRLTDLDFQYNKIDSVPNLSNLNNLRVFHADSNRLTFDDIDRNSSYGMTYTLQDSIFKDTTYAKRVGNALMINLGTDGAMTSNTYKWYKNDSLIFTGNANTFSINSLRLSDAGNYRAVVSNPDMPNVTLYSRKAIVNVVDSVPVTCRTQDSLSLVALYNATGGANWTNRWNLTQPMTAWYGITLDAAGCVKCIDLDGVADCAYNYGTGNNLVGTLPNLNMASLQMFIVSYNSGITGTIPTFTMPLLETLDIRSDRLTGSLPSFNLPNLKYLYFNNNLLTGSIPNFNLPNLSIIYGMKNQLSGAIPDFSATNLKFLYFDTNQLTGSVPNFTLQTLEDIDFSNNQLTGTIPNFTIQSLKAIRLYNNRLTGTIPNFNLPNLKWIELQNNQLTGTIPNFAATGLINLLLSNNQLTGSIPNFNYPNLEYLHLYTNQLTGTIPTFTLPVLKELLLYDNQLTGSIPNFVMPQLLSLKLYNNQLTGSIPNFNMPLLTHIVLNTNQLSGSIPNFSMPNLVLLDLYKNQLTGNFPSGLSTILNKVRIDTNRFTFSHLIPNFTNLPTAIDKTYAPQDSIFSDTTYSKRVGDSLTIDLAIDNTLTSNLYTWSKNGTFYGTTRINKLIINGLQTTHAGTYTCAVTNPTAPNLTLYSRKAIVTVSAVVSACRTQDSLALVDLYNATGGNVTGGANWRRSDNWLSRAPINNWYGVFVNAQGCVDTLLLDNNRLSGTLPTSMGNMTNLKVLFMPNNQLTGAIPTQLGNLNALVMLYLHKNQLTGSLPTELGNLTNLRELGISENGLEGSIPTSLGNLTNLTRLYLSRNRLTGAIPTTLRTMSALNDLYLDNNQLSDTIPSGLSQLSGLKNLFLGNNNLSGTIPTTFGRLSSLQYLLLDNNNLSGTVPDSLGNLSQLQTLELDSNQLVGKIPVTFQRLTNLQSLHFHGNRIDSVPSLANLPLRADTVTSVSGVFVTNRRGLRVQQNQLTFDDIAPNYNFLSTATYLFSPQDSFFKDTTYRKRTGDTLIVDLKIDGALTTNNYNWYKNDVFLTSTTFNKLIINRLQSSHAGIYTCQVTNQTVDGFRLYSRKITLIVDSIGCQPARDTAWTTTLCAGQRYRLPLGRIVNTLGNHRDTLKSILNTTCDSIRYTISLINDTGGRCQDSLALVQLYDSTNGSNWRLNTNWRSDSAMNTWYGITLNAQGLVSTISLEGDSLKGAFPPNFGVGNLSNLVVLRLHLNRLRGNMPPFNSSKLQEIRLYQNELTGSLPNFNLPQLRILDLWYNQFSGNIPDFNQMPLLEYLWVNGNRMSGSLPSFSNLTNLTLLRLSENQFSGTIPSFNLPRLEAAWLYSNQFDSLPDLTHLSTLNNLSVATNRLTFDDILPNRRLQNGLGYTPQDSIFRDTTIRAVAGTNLSVSLGIDGALTTNVYKWYKNDTLFRTDSVNRLIINGLQISHAGKYTCVVTNPNAPLLTLYSRKITLTVSARVCPPTQDTTWNSTLCAGRTYSLPSGRTIATIGTYQDTLRSVLDATCDSIRYSIRVVADSSCRCVDSTALVDLYNSTRRLGWIRDTNWLSSNPIPTWYGVNVNAQGCVEMLFLNDNRLTDTLPNNVGTIRDLKVFNLYNNQLSGKIPTTLGNLANLNQLQLRNNQLTGSIPATLGGLTALQLLYLSDNRLSDSIPSHLGNLRQLRDLGLHNNQLTGSIPTNLGNIDSLRNLYLDSNRLTGNIPVSLERLTQLQQLHLWNNQLTGSLPTNLSRTLNSLAFHRNRIDSVPSLLSYTGLTAFFVENNRLTFDDILPNVPRGIRYNPQDSIFSDTLFAKNTGDILSISLGIDGALTTNVYKWYKNDTLLYRTNNVNQLIFNGLQVPDAGQYTCKVTNPNAPNLTLYSRKITLRVTETGCPPTQDTTLNPTLCTGQTYRLPTGRTVSTIGTYGDTLRSVLRATCDSIRYVINIGRDTGCHCTDSLVLVSLFNATGGANWTRRVNWLSTNSIQTWAGVAVNAQGCVDSLSLNNNQLTNNLPTNLVNLTQLKYLSLQNNRLTGSVPTTFRTFPVLNTCLLDTNRLDSVPLLGFNNMGLSYNRFTFDDILPNRSRNASYAPQDSIFSDTTIRVNAGQNLVIPLGIDGGLTSNRYKWYKNDTLLYRTDSVNQLIINGLQLSDAGPYTCKVTNLNAPNLTLYSRKITLLVTPVVPVVTPCRTRDSLALVALYHQNAVTALRRDDLNWFTPANRPLETWANNSIPLTLSAAGCVTVLDLSNIGLNGILADSIGNMTELEELYLQNNNLNNRLPNGLNRLTRLKNLLLSNNLLTGFPDSIRKLVNLQELDLDGNEITGNIPSELGSLPQMRLLKLSENNLDGKIPIELGHLNRLQELTLSDNNLIDSIPSNLGRLPNLKKLFLDRNGLTGKIPISFQQLRVLTELNFASNQLDSCPSLATLANLISCNASGNRLTFNGILPNLGHRFLFNYAPQDSIFRDTTYHRNAGDALTIDLGIDGNVPNNVYKWYHNGVLDTTIATNRLIINSLQGNDGGIYTCVVTNPNAPNLSLHSRKAVLNLNCTATSQQRDTAICQGQFYTLPTGQTVTVAGTYRDTLRSRLFCDSIIVTRLALRSKDTTQLNLDDCSIARTQTDTTVLSNRFGCDSLVIRKRTARRDSIERRMQFTCRANEVGIRILSRSTNRFGCDSIDYQRVVLAPSYRRDTTIWRCNQPDQTVDSVFRTLHGCDSVVAYHYRFCRKDSTVIQHTVCNSRRDSIIRLRNFCGCDSTVIHKFNVPNLDTVLQTEVVCNVAYVGTSAVVLKHEVAPFCDSLVTITQRVFDICGCLQDSTQLYTGLIPNDGDNQNDYFIIPLLEQYTPNELVITDKRGMLVYRTLNYKNDWGGTNQNGEPLPQGVYNFVFRTATSNCLRRGVIDIKYIP